eukprot:scaffold48158_cov60-Phaeocystis_antarctica.AAC.3
MRIQICSSRSKKVCSRLALPSVAWTCAMLVSAKVGFAHEGRSDTSTVAAALDFRLGLLDCRGDASSVAVEAPADDERGMRRRECRCWECTQRGGSVPCGRQVFDKM